MEATEQYCTVDYCVWQRRKTQKMIYPTEGLILHGREKNERRRERTRVLEGVDVSLVFIDSDTIPSALLKYFCIQ